MRKGRSKPADPSTACAETEEQRQERFDREPGEIHIRVSERNIFGRIGLSISKLPLDYRTSGRTLAARFMWHELEPKVLYYPAGFILPVEPEEAAIMANQLWDLGIRPAAAKGSAGQLEAVQKHLAHLERDIGRLTQERDKLLDELLTNSQWLRIQGSLPVYNVANAVECDGTADS